MNKKVVILGILAICLSISIGIGFSYAVWNQTEKQEEANAYQTGCFAISITNQENAINLRNQFPITDNEGKQLVPFTFTVENTCDYYASYAINLEILENSTLKDKYIKVMLDDNDPVRFDNEKLTAATTVENNSIESKTLATSGVDAHKSNNHSLRIWMDEDASTDAANKILNSKIVISAVATEKPLTGADYLETLLADNPTMIIQDDTEDKNLRFIGANPNNYVKFNDELWRIIGVFNNMLECPDDDGVNIENYTDTCTEKKLIKLFKSQNLSYIKWNNTRSNDWTNSSLMKLLNYGDYWNRENDYSTSGLGSEAKNIIANTMWNLGRITAYNTSNASMYYAAERSPEIYQGFPSKWIGKVGLIYPSDYGFSVGGGTEDDRSLCLNTELYNWPSSCMFNSWIGKYNLGFWTLTTYSNGIGNAFAAGNHVRDAYVDTLAVVAPVVYLKSNVKIIDGEGTSEIPYQLSI